MKNSTLYSLLAVFALFFSTLQTKAQTNIAPQATVTASSCNTGPCSAINDGNYGVCGTQIMWISTSSPPSSTPGVNYIDFTWPSAQTFDEITIYQAWTTRRVLTGAVLQRWDANSSSWVTFHTFGNVTPLCDYSVSFSPQTSNKLRITAFEMNGPGQTSNPSIREIEVFQAILIPDNAATLAVDSPAVFCEGTHNVVATIANRGINQLDSVRVNWSFGGVPQPTYHHTSTLDTMNGVGASEAQVVLGSKTFTSGVSNEIVVWTSHPNGVSDTFNFDDTAKAIVQPAIYGNFTLDPNGSGVNNYIDWTSLAQDLSDFGVCGPVVVDVAAGVYTEQATFGDISGASSVNTITFNADTAGVTLENSSSSGANWVVGLEGADWVTFNDFTFEATGSSYSTVVSINSGGSSNTFNNCVFNGYANATTSTNQAIIYSNSPENNDNMFQNCEFNGGSYGIYFRGSSTTSRSSGNSWENCDFIDQYYRCGYFYYTSNLHFNYNVVRSSRNYSSFYAIYSYYSNGDFQVIGNDINVPGYTPLYMGYTEGDNTNKPLIANNMIRVGKNAGSYGYGIYAYNAGFTRIVNNTLVLTHSTGTYRAIYITGGANTIMNNNIHDQNGYSSSTSYACIYINGGFAVLDCDYNNYYTNRTVGYLSGAYSTLSDWQNATGFDMHSLTTDPMFVNFDSLRTCSDTLDGAGTPLSYITDDFDGDGRHPMTPDIGADEWVGSDSGAYSAGPDAFICDGKSAVIGLEVSGGTFLWSNSETTSTIEVTSEGIYTVAMTSDCGASHTDTVVVEDITPTATFDLTPSDNTFHTIDADNTSDHGDSYMWTVIGTGVNDTLTSMDLTHIVPDNGPFEVCLYTYNDCDTASSCQTWAGVVGIQDADLSNMISLMPNPVSDVLTIQFEGIEGDVTVEMSNVQGQVVHRDRYMNVSGNAVQEVNVSSLRKGMYIVKFVTETGIATEQIIVQ